MPIQFLSMFTVSIFLLHKQICTAMVLSLDCLFYIIAIIAASNYFGLYCGPALGRERQVDVLACVFLTE